jgi:hypothetical protein
MLAPPGAVLCKLAARDLNSDPNIDAQQAIA